MVNTASRSAPSTIRPAVVISIRDLKTHCNSCSMRELCLPVGLERGCALRSSTRWSPAAPGSRKATRSTAPANAFTALYAIRTRLVQDDDARRGRPRAGRRLPHAGRRHRHGRHRHRAPRLRGDRARGYRVLRAAVRPARGARAAALPSLQHNLLPLPVARHRPRPVDDADAGQHARRGAPRRVPVEPVRALPRGAATRRPSSCCA